MNERQEEIRNIRAGIRQEPQTIPPLDITTGGRTSIVNEDVHLTDAKHLHEIHPVATPPWVRDLYPAERKVYNLAVDKYKLTSVNPKWTSNYTYLFSILQNGRYVVVNLTTDKTKTFDDKSELRFDF